MYPEKLLTPVSGAFAISLVDALSAKDTAIATTIAIIRERAACLQQRARLDVNMNRASVGPKTACVQCVVRQEHWA